MPRVLDEPDLKRATKTWMQKLWRCEGQSHELVHRLVEEFGAGPAKSLICLAP